MKEFQIEKVKTNLKEGNVVFVQMYLPHSDTIDLQGYAIESIARLKVSYEVGMWRVKPTDK